MMKLVSAYRRLCANSSWSHPNQPCTLAGMVFSALLSLATYWALSAFCNVHWGHVPL